jgi:hypothetical protein
MTKEGTVVPFERPEGLPPPREPGDEWLGVEAWFDSVEKAVAGLRVELARLKAEVLEWRKR